MKKLSHLGESGNIQMVDISSKIPTLRRARCSGRIYMKSETINLIKKNKIEKGNVLTTAKIAGILAAKQTDKFIPLCHTISMDIIDLNFEINENFIEATSLVETTYKTGVEMEAFMVVSIALLTIYDMCKSVDRTMEIDEIKLLEKRGGKTTFYRNKILSINISKDRGTIKRPVREVKIVKNFGIESDAHSEKNSPRQISILSTLSIEKIRKKGLNIKYGEFGENLTIKDIPIYEIPVGTKIKCGNEVELEITQIGKECINRCSIYEQVGDCVMPREGVFARVLRGGILQVNEDIVIEY